jgi:hypothetical protein
MKALPLSRSTRRSSPCPSKVLPNSSTTVRSSLSGTDRVRSFTLVRTSVTGTGTSVSGCSIRVPSARWGPVSLSGRRSMYCSPTAESPATTARVSAGMRGADFLMRSSATTPSSVSSIGPTRPTDTPR